MTQFALLLNQTKNSYFTKYFQFVQILTLVTYNQKIHHTQDYKAIGRICLYEFENAYNNVYKGLILNNNFGEGSQTSPEDNY